MPTQLEAKMYIKCKVSKGIFSSEYHIAVANIKGEYTAGFADKQSVKIKKEPQEGETLEGFAKVYLIEEHKDKYLIQLPTEMQDSIFVPKERLELFI
ncbi:MAG: hypothetical protein V1886_01190 [archaeon]